MENLSECYRKSQHAASQLTAASREKGRSWTEQHAGAGPCVQQFVDMERVVLGAGSWKVM